MAVQRGLENLGIELGNKGYEVVMLESYSYPIDAIVYSGSFPQVSYITGNNMPQMRLGERSSYGVLLVNSYGKSIDDIDLMLKNRCYSPLF